MPWRGQRSQSMVEFALIAPVVLVLFFVFIDAGRAIFYFETAQEAANEAVAAAVLDSRPLPTNSTAVNVAATHLTATIAPTCPNGPIQSSTPSAGTAWVYVTQAPPPSSGTSSVMDAPGGEASTTHGTCSDTTPASGQVELEVTVVYNFAPITPIIGSFSALTTLRASATGWTEY